MRHAPSVSYPVGRSRFEAGLLLALGLVTACVLLAWQLQTPTPSMLWALPWLLLVMLGWRHWRAAPQGVLRWQGGQWCFDAVPIAAPQVRLDLQGVMLLQISAHSPAWLWLSRRSVPAQWNALRRAVYARSSVPEVPGPVDAGAAS